MAETRARHAEYALEWPVEHDGQTIDSITLRRLTGGEVAGLQERMIGDGATDAAMIAAFADRPAEVIASLDADDFPELKDMVIAFLPRRIRAAVEQAMGLTLAAPVMAAGNFEEELIQFGNLADLDRERLQALSRELDALSRRDITGQSSSTLLKGIETYVGKGTSAAPPRPCWMPTRTCRPCRSPCALASRSACLSSRRPRTHPGR